MPRSEPNPSPPACLSISFISIFCLLANLLAAACRHDLDGTPFYPQACSDPGLASGYEACFRSGCRKTPCQRGRPCKRSCACPCLTWARRSSTGGRQGGGCWSVPFPLSASPPLVSLAVALRRSHFLPSLSIYFLLLFLFFLLEFIGCGRDRRSKTFLLPDSHDL